ncbi:facilitated trehalose transporter Tret1-like isoform X2 [Bacillus rossius redtenbacheri]|uniref:facilitated trehalose transporter Tret1-like isoform X2 n=1 Tax=Bacillus rossius redtenbacheri TaxID=93214 RepID=UPI002FDCB869
MPRPWSAYCDSKFNSTWRGFSPDLPRRAGCALSGPEARSAPPPLRGASVAGGQSAASDERHARAAAGTPPAAAADDGGVAGLPDHRPGARVLVAGGAVHAAAGAAPRAARGRRLLGAIPPLGAMIGSLVAGPLLQNIGRKRTLMVSSPLFLAGWACIATAQNYPMLLCARLLTGFCAGIVTPSAQVYVTECAHADIRGILGSLPALFMAGGILVAYLLGAWLPWNLLAWSCAIFPTLQFFVMLPLPESPAWYLSRGCHEEAAKAMKWLHHSSESKDQVPQIDQRRGSIFAVAPVPPVLPEDEPEASKTKLAGSYNLKALLRRPVIMPFVLSLTILVFQQFSGIDTIIFYTVTIFQAAGSSVDEHLATIFVGLVQLIANFMALFLIDRSGRRPLLVISGALMCMSMAAMGTHFYLQKTNFALSKNLGMLPLLSMIVFMVGFSVGYCSIPFLLMGELLPVRQRSFLSSVVGSINLGSMFVVIKTYPLIEDLIGAYGAFWLYAAFCLASCVFVICLVPETKGKTLDEIEAHFEESNRLRKEKIAMSLRSHTMAETNVDKNDDECAKKCNELTIPNT